MAHSTPLAITRDINGYVAYGLQPSVQGIRFVLGANDLKTVTVPIGPALKYLALITYYSGANVWVQFDEDTVLALPTSTPTDTTSELLPTEREVSPGQVIQFISVAAGGGVGIKYYAIQ